MNCPEVDKIVAGLARGESDGDALTHIEGCPACRQRLEEERRLSAGLAAWAESCESEEAPAALESRLLAEFRRGAASRRPAAVSWKWLLPLAAAALFSFRIFAPEHPEPVAIPTEPLVATVVGHAPAPPRDSVVEPPKPRLRPRPRRTAQPPRIVPAAQPASPQFIPVPQGDRWTPADGGRLVRVGLPRTALLHFGLPMLEERAQEEVQADVVLSNDGLVRAIRFVP